MIYVRWNINGLNYSADFPQCKDCKHFYRYGERWGVCEYTREHQGKALDVTPEHFCGWGERK